MCYTTTMPVEKQTKISKGEAIGCLNRVVTSYVGIFLQDLGTGRDYGSGKPFNKDGHYALLHGLWSNSLFFSFFANIFVKDNKITMLNCLFTQWF